MVFEKQTTITYIHFWIFSKLVTWVLLKLFVERHHNNINLLEKHHTNPIRHLGEKEKISVA
jgi:hypothetical protein